MNTGQKNSQGRTIYRGPRGGEYVLGPGGRKSRVVTADVRLDRIDTIPRRWCSG